MAYFRALFSYTYWKHGFSVEKAGLGLLSSFGALWLVVEIVSYFSIPLASTIRGRADLFLVAGIAFAAYLNRPLHDVRWRLKGRDILLRIVVGDAFKFPGALIVGCNTTFETAQGPISPHSVQGQFTRKYFASPAHLDLQVKAFLAREVPIGGGAVGAKPRYEMGTCAMVNGNGRTGYLLAIAELNQHGVTKGNINDLQIALPRLWECVATRGSIEPLVTPVLGTGFSRLPEPREQIIREIINSFVAACSGQRFTESLTIVIPARDFYANGVNMPSLAAYLGHVCAYSEYATHTVGPRGRGIGNG